MRPTIVRAPRKFSGDHDDPVAQQLPGREAAAGSRCQGERRGREQLRTGEDDEGEAGRGHHATQDLADPIGQLVRADLTRDGEDEAESDVAPRCESEQQRL